MSHWQHKKGGIVMEKQLYEKTFSSKKKFLKWLEENEDNIDWDYEVEFSWYYKND